MHTQWWKYRPLVHDRKAQLLPTKSRNAPTTSKQFGQNVERIAKKYAILGPRPQTGANCARGQIASLDISKSCRIVRKLVVCWTKYEYDSALERVTGLKQFPLTEPHDRQPGSQICFWTVEVLSLLFFSIVQNFQTGELLSLLLFCMLYFDPRSEHQHGFQLWCYIP